MDGSVEPRRNRVRPDGLGVERAGLCVTCQRGWRRRRLIATVQRERERHLLVSLHWLRADLSEALRRSQSRLVPPDRLEGRISLPVETRLFVVQELDEGP